MTVSHQEFVEKRIRRDPRFAAELQAATAELDLGEALFRRRDETGLTLAHLASETGIAEERLEAIEGGESMTLHEVLWLLHTLQVSVSIGTNFDVVPKTLAAAESRR